MAHYNGVIRTSWGIKLPASWLFVYIMFVPTEKVPKLGITGPFCKTTPPERASNAELPLMTSSNGNSLTIVYSNFQSKHQSSALLANCAGNSPVPGEFPIKRPVTRSFDVYFDLRPNKSLSKHLWGCFFRRFRDHYDVIVMKTNPCHDVTMFYFRREFVFRYTLLLAPSHYNGVIMGSIGSQITSLTVVYSAVYSGADQRKHQSSASLAFVWGIHRGPLNSPHK